MGEKQEHDEQAISEEDEEKVEHAKPCKQSEAAVVILRCHIENSLAEVRRDYHSEQKAKLEQLRSTVVGESDGEGWPILG